MMTTTRCIIYNSTSNTPPLVLHPHTKKTRRLEGTTRRLSYLLRVYRVRLRGHEGRRANASLEHGVLETAVGVVAAPA